MSNAESTITGMIDSHFHVLEMRKRTIDCEQLFSSLFENGFAGGMDIGVDAQDVSERFEILQNWPNVRIAAGLGPWHAQGDHDLDKLVGDVARQWEALPIDCIGEIGLDNYWNYGTRERQERLFILQLDVAEQLGLPVAIHMRDADGQMQSIIKSRAFPYGGILHCYASSLEFAERAMKQNLLISFAGPITYKNNNALREILSKIPDESLLLETDSPYLAPHPFRGKTNTPMYIGYIYREASRIRSTSVESLVDVVKHNFERVMGSSAKRVLTEVR